MTQDKKIYIGLKAIIRKKEKVLVLFKSNQLTIPGGKIQIKENDLEKSLKREVYEETTLKIKVIRPFHAFIFKPFNHKAKEILALVYECEYLKGDVKLNHEHERFEWHDKKSFTKLKEKTEFYNSLKIYFSQN